MKNQLERAEPSRGAPLVITKLRATRDAYHNQYGVPISHEYAEFLNAIGDLAAGHVVLLEALRRLQTLLPNVAQIFDGWHNDGTAWSEWDESIRKRRGHDGPHAPAADAGPRQPVQVERSLLEGILNFMNRRFDGDRLLKHQAHFIGELHRALDTSPPVPQEAAPAPSSNSITVARESFTPTDTQELMKCPTCHGYHIGGCHRATAPDSAMRVAREVIKYVESTGDNGAIMDEQVAKVIRESGSDEITKLRADYDREHKWLNDAASEANSDLDSVASVIRKLREAGSERERELTRRLQITLADIDTLLEIADSNVHPKVLDMIKLSRAEASRLLGGESCHKPQKS